MRIKQKYIDPDCQSLSGQLGKTWGPLMSEPEKEKARIAAKFVSIIEKLVSFLKTTLKEISK